MKTPKYKRQKFLLLLIDKAKGNLSKMDLQKLLFLIQKDRFYQYYDFIPYHYGCYSFQAAEDLEILEKLNWISLSGNSVILKKRLPMDNFSFENTAVIIENWMSTFKALRGNKLIKHIYYQFPYYAIFSKMGYRIANEETKKKIAAVKRKIQNNTKVLFTIGYEGITFENYVNDLIKNNIQLLCDVRKNPLSRKFGFSKGTLSTVLPKLGIKYYHFPELGIVSEKRLNLNSDEDYRKLFKIYQKSLPDNYKSLKRIYELLRKYNRIALTCFENQPQYCHRHCISDYLSKDFVIKVKHI